MPGVVTPAAAPTRNQFRIQSPSGEIVAESLSRDCRRDCPARRSSAAAVALAADRAQRRYLRVILVVLALRLRQMRRLSEHLARATTLSLVAVLRVVPNFFDADLVQSATPMSACSSSMSLWIWAGRDSGITGEPNCADQYLRSRLRDGRD